MEAYTESPQEGTQPQAEHCLHSKTKFRQNTLNNVTVSQESNVRVLGPKLILETGLVKFVTAAAGLVCPDLLGLCLSRSANIYFGPSMLLDPSSSLQTSFVIASRSPSPGGLMNASETAKQAPC